MQRKGTRVPGLQVGLAALGAARCLLGWREGRLWLRSVHRALQRVTRDFCISCQGHPTPAGSWRLYASSDDIRWSLRTPSRHVSKAAAMTRPPPGVPPSSHVTPGADGNHLRSAPPGLQLGGRAAVCSWAAGEGQTLGASALQRGCCVLSKQQ